MFRAARSVPRPRGFQSAKGLHRLGAAGVLPWSPAFPMKPRLGTRLGSERHDTGAFGFKLAAPCTAARWRWSWVAVAPLDYASLECLCLRRRSGEAAIELELAGKFAEASASPQPTIPRPPAPPSVSRISAFVS